jgi:hypothetical protein
MGTLADLALIALVLVIVLFRYHHHHSLDPALDRGRVPPPCGVASFFPTPSTASGRGSLSNLIRNEETEGIHCSSSRFPTGY